MQRFPLILPRAKGHSLWSADSYCLDVVGMSGQIGAKRGNPLHR
jgi:hypothetical protein